eukprot:PhM_4_TR715/c0_g1_i1/m.104836/K15100/SLC25A1, CTP; solute carrier family 25 (mitochondrial citrate transporter), member 1
MTATPTESPWKPILCSLLGGGITGGLEVFVTYPTDYVKTLLQLQKTESKSGAAATSSRPSQPHYRGALHCAYVTVQEHGPLGLYRGMSPILAGAIPKQGIRWGTFESACALIKRGEDRSVTGFERSVCGMSAGVVEALAVVPAETVKVRLIEDQRSGHPKYRGFVHGVGMMLREDGIRGIYRGASAMVLRQAVNQATRFPAQFYTLQALVGDDPKKRKSAAWNGISGVIAGCISVCINQPADVVRTRMQSAVYGSSWACCVALYKEGGVPIFYRGTLPRMARVGPNVGLTFTLFPVVRDKLKAIL